MRTVATSSAPAGQREAFEQLVVATSAQVFALALRLVGNEHDARDVVQETYLRAYRSIGDFRGEASLSTWLYRICANCAANHLRRRSRRRTEPLADLPELADVRAALDLDAVESAGDDRARLSKALRDLAPALRAVVVLHDLYGLDHEAIADELGISRAASKVRLHRGRRKLRELLFPHRNQDEHVDGVVSIEFRAPRHKGSGVDHRAIG